MARQFDAQQLDWLANKLGLSEPPLAVFYTDKRPAEGFTPEPGPGSCIFAGLRKVRQDGGAAFFDAEHYACLGGAYYMGFRGRAPEVHYFVSTGIPGKMEGERYIKSPEIALRFFEGFPVPRAGGEYCVAKRLPDLADDERAEVVIFFVPPDPLSGLVFLTTFAAEMPDAVRTPMSSGCGSIITWARLEAQAERPHAILGGFDPSARPFIEPELLTLAVPAALFQRMLDDAPDSFLTGPAWTKLRERIS